MAAKQDPVSGLNYGWTLGEDNWNVGMDSNLVKLGATINITVLDFAATPSVTTNGTRYIVASGSGAFAGQNNKLAVRVEDAWTFYTLPEGCIVYDEDTNAHYKFEGGSYVLVVDFVSNQTLKAWAYSQSFALISATRNSNDVITTANVKWPDGTSGVFTSTTINSTFNTIDAWSATYLGSTTKTITQSAVTRNLNGAVNVQPEITIT